MKKVCVFYSIMVLFLTSCKEDFICEEGVNCPETIAQQNDDDNINDDNVQDQRNEAITFTDEEGNSFLTGIDCENPSPDYSVSQDILLENLEIPDDLPTEFDLNTLVPPVGNQGMQGSCVSWAVTYYTKSIQEKVQFNHEYNTSTLMSPAYTYNQLAKGTCGGTSITQTLDLLKEQGTTGLDVFPYIENNCANLPNEEQTNLAINNKISDYKNLSGHNMVNEMKTLLVQLKPIIISAILDGEFGKRDTSGITAYREHKVDYKNGRCHAMTVVGYSDENNAFKVVNSWGTSWGDNGYVWIDYKAFENVLSNDDFRVITSAYVAFDAN